MLLLVGAEGEEFALDSRWIVALFLAADNRHLAADYIGKAAETPFLEKGQEGRCIPVPQPPRVPIHGHGHVRGQADQLPAQADRLGGGTEILLLLGARDPLDIGHDVVERAVFLQEFGGCLQTDAGDSGHVVHRVANERLQVDDLLRRNAPVLEQCLAIEDCPLAQVVKADAVVDQLPAILVVGADKDIDAAAGRGRRHRGNNIIRLIARLAEDRQPHGFQQPIDLGNLQLKIIRRGRPVGLVVGIDGVAEGWARLVESAQEVVRLLLGTEEKQVAREAEQGIGRQSGRAAHRRNGVKNLKDERVSIDQIHAAVGGARRHDKTTPGKTRTREGWLRVQPSWRVELSGMSGAGFRPRARDEYQEGRGRPAAPTTRSAKSWRPVDEREHELGHARLAGARRRRFVIRRSSTGSRPARERLAQQ